MALTIQKANFWKRISAYLFDLIITVMLAVGIAAILSALLGYDKTSAQLESYYTEYETQYGVDFDLTEAQLNELSQEERARYDEAVKAFSQDERVLRVYQKSFFLSLVIVSAGLLLAVLTVHFVVPLFFKNGQTLGKKIFGVAVMRSSCVKVSNPVLFIRTLFGLYAIETIFPIALLLMVYFGLLGSVGGITVFLLFALQIGVLIANKNNGAIHDLLADTVVVDMASQRIFATEEELLAFKRAEHAEEVAKKDYI